MPRHRVCYQLSPRSLELAFVYLSSFLGATAASSYTTWDRPPHLSSLAAHCRGSCGFCSEERQGMEVSASPVARHAGRQAVNAAGPPQGWARCEWLSSCGAPSQLLGSACAGDTRHGAAATGYCFESSWGSLECGRRLPPTCTPRTHLSLEYAPHDALTTWQAGGPTRPQRWRARPSARRRAPLCARHATPLCWRGRRAPTAGGRLCARDRWLLRPLGRGACAPGVLDVPTELPIYLPTFRS